MTIVVEPAVTYVGQIYQNFLREKPRYDQYSLGGNHKSGEMNERIGWERNPAEEESETSIKNRLHMFPSHKSPNSGDIVVSVLFARSDHVRVEQSAKRNMSLKLHFKSTDLQRHGHLLNLSPDIL
jgi:hypothetical protein